LVGPELLGADELRVGGDLLLVFHLRVVKEFLFLDAISV
jgi:hypothetical protein